MATVTTSVNLDTITRAAIENFTISNGATLTINTDVRYSAGAPAAGGSSLGDIDCSATTPGTVLIDGRDVWWLPITGGTGTVPGYNAIISGVTSGSTGLFMNVTSGLQYAPLASGATMPTTGYIKFKSKTGLFTIGEALRNYSAGDTALGTAGSGQVGWIEIPMRETDAIDLAGNGTFAVSGEWFYLDNTTGIAGQIIQGPTYGGDNTYYPGIWIETSIGSGEFLAWPAIYAGGTSPWKNPANSGIATDLRGKYVESLSRGRYRIGSDGSTNIGYVPASGLRTRIPNVLLVNTSSAGSPQNNVVPHATVATRPDFVTATPGEVLIDKAMTNWYFYLNKFRNVRLEHLALFDTAYLLYVGAPFLIDDLCIGSYTHSDTSILRLSACSFGGSLLNSHIVRAAASPGSGDYGLYVSDSSDILISGCVAAILAPRAANSAYSMIVGANNTTIKNCKVIGGTTRISQNNVVIDGLEYCDNIWGNTTTAIPVTNGALYIYTAADITVRNISLYSGLTQVHPYGPFVYIDLSSNVNIENCGTRLNPLDHGSSAIGAVSFSTGANSTCNNIKIRRCYTQNASTGFWQSGTPVDTVKIVNCGGDYEDALTSSTNVATNTQVRGLACSSWGTTDSSARGSHFYNIFVNTVSGRLGVPMNEPSTVSNTYCSLTPISADTLTGWTREGTLVLTEAGDIVQWTWPFPILGVNGFQNSDGVLTGTNTSNHTMYYAIKYPNDSDYSAWKTATAANLAAETPSDSLGFNLKIMISGNTSSTSNALTSAYLLTYCSGTAQDVLYPLEENFVTISTNGLLANSRIQLYNMTVSGEMANELVTTGEYSLEFDTEWYSAVASDGDTIRLRATKLGYLPFESLGIFSSDTGLEFVVDQEIDEVYATNGIDGPTVTEYSLDIPNVEIDMNDPDGTTTVQRGYAWFNHVLTTESGIRNAFGGFDAIDEYNYRANSEIINFKFDNVNADPLHITGGYVFRSDGGQIIASGSGPLFLDAGKAYIANGGSVSASGVWSEVIEGTLTAKEVQRILLAVAAGITTITEPGESGGDATVKFYDVSTSGTARVIAEMTGSERTDITVNGD